MLSVWRGRIAWTSVLLASWGLGGLASSAADPPGLGLRGELAAVEFEPGGVPVLVGRNARRQLIVTGAFSSGQRHDLTHDVEYSTDKPGILTVSADGQVTPLSDGEATITARTSAVSFSRWNPVRSNSSSPPTIKACST